MRHHHAPEERRVPRVLKAAQDRSRCPPERWGRLCREIPARSKEAQNIMIQTRLSNPADIPRQRELWQLAFGDEGAYVDNFYDTCYRPERMLMLEEDGVVQAMTAWFDTTFVVPERGGVPGGLSVRRGHPSGGPGKRAGRAAALRRGRLFPGLGHSGGDDGPGGALSPPIFRAERLPGMLCGRAVRLFMRRIEPDAGVGPDAAGPRGLPNPPGGAAGRHGPHRPAGGGPGLSDGGLRPIPRGAGCTPSNVPTGRRLCAPRGWGTAGCW